MIYPIVEGKTLKIDLLSNFEIEQVAKKIIKFNNELHNVKVDWGKSTSINHEMEKVYRNIDLLKNYLTKTKNDCLNKYAIVFDNYIKSKDNFCLTHGDLWADNLIVNEDVPKQSVNLFIVHRELCSFEYIMDSTP